MCLWACVGVDLPSGLKVDGTITKFGAIYSETITDITNYI